MEIKKATIAASYNPAAPSELLCDIIGGAAGEAVKYTSPFNNLDSKGAAITGYPQINDIVLIVKPSNSEDWYYMSTVVGVEVLEDEGGKTRTVSNPPRGATVLDPDDKRFKSVGMKGSAGQQLEFLDLEAEPPFGQPTLDKGVFLNDGDGGRLSMVKGPNASVNLETLGGDVKLKLNKNYNSMSWLAPSTLLAKSQGNATVKSNSGALNLVVGPTGRKIEITNWASRFAQSAGAFDFDAGDIDITSRRNSVNIKASSLLPSEQPAVFIEASKVNPTSVVSIRSGGKVEINALTELHLNCAGVIKINGLGGVHINGAEVHLNNPLYSSPSAPSKSNYDLAVDQFGGG